MSKITITPEQRKILLAEWNIVTIRRALRGESQTYTAALIRKRALEIGGIELK